MKVKLDIGKLHLPGSQGTGMEAGRPVAVARPLRLEAVRDLRKCGLSWLLVRRLIRRLEPIRYTRDVVRQWPTIGEDREVIQAVADLAQALSTVITGASPRALFELEMAARSSGQDFKWATNTGQQLMVFSAMLGVRLQRMPKQSRHRPPPVDVVQQVAAVVGDQLGAPSVSETSAFWRACCAACRYIGHTSTPERAVRALMGGAPQPQAADASPSQITVDRP